MYENYSKYAGFWKRVLAHLVDGLVVWVCMLPIASVYREKAGEFANAIGPQTSPQNAIAALMVLMPITLEYFAFCLIVGLLYYAGFESSNLQGTPGKLALGIKVIDTEGQRVSFARATGRHFSKIVSGMTLLIGYIMCAFTERRQCLHDMMAGCLVISALHANEFKQAGKHRELSPPPPAWVAPGCVLAVVAIGGFICFQINNSSIYHVASAPTAPPPGNPHRVDFRIVGLKNDAMLNQIAGEIDKSSGVSKSAVSGLRPYWATVVYDADKTNFASIIAPLQKDHVSFVVAEERPLAVVPPQLNPGEGMPEVADETPASSESSGSPTSNAAAESNLAPRKTAEETHSKPSSKVQIAAAKPVKPSMPSDAGSEKAAIKRPPNKKPAVHYKSGPRAIIGTWQWFTNGDVTFYPNGTMRAGGITGTWTLLGPSLWAKWSNGWYNTLQLSADGTTLNGFGSTDPNQLGTQHVWGRKISP